MTQEDISALPLVQELDDVYVLGLRASTDEQSWSLLLMESDDAEDEQDIALGMDTYCLLVDLGRRRRTAASWSAS